MTLSPTQLLEFHALRLSIEAMSRVLTGESVSRADLDVILEGTIAEQDRRVRGNRGGEIETLADARLVFVATLKEALERMEGGQ
jgi:hypothetical protein